jgi:hypothetical protein
MPNTVWVLGAGFSRSLGAPLLHDLFQPESIEEARVYFPEAGFPKLSVDLMAARAAYNRGKSIANLWADPEQFLAFVDDAYGGYSSARREHLKILATRKRPDEPGLDLFSNTAAPLARIIGEDLRRAARRALAAETSRFLMSDRTSELWIPYQHWASQLGQEDTIITFNYDLVIDFLGDSFSIPLPNEKPEPGKIPVFKVHGSVNWVEDGSSWRRVREFEALTDPAGACPAIAAPGRSKALNGAPPFPELWAQAEEKLNQSQWVIFLGYRFPPTDALAKQRLLDALRKPGGRRLRRVDTVLGPNVGSDDSHRLSTLLESSRGERRIVDRSNPLPLSAYGLKIVRQPLFGEDFLLVHTQMALDETWF